MKNSQISLLSLIALGVGLLLFNWGLYSAKQSDPQESFNTLIVVGIILVLASVAANIYGLAKRKSQKKHSS